MTDTIKGSNMTDSSVEYWERRVLNVSSGISEPGTILYELALCLLLGWIIVYLCILKGIKTSGKVLYFSAPFPYLLLLIMLIRTCMLPGAGLGLKYYVTPDFSKLKNLEVWVDAGTQVFFSYSIGLGTLTALGSYNSFHHNSFRDCLIFATVNSGTSIFAGLVIFATLGFMAESSGLPLSEVAAPGPGLVFMVYPQALAQMPGAPFWSVLFFLMLLLLGLDTQFVAVEGVITGMTDLFPVFFSKGYRRSLFTGLSCVFLFFFGLSMVTQGGMYVFLLFDYFIGSRITLVVAAIQCLIIMFGFGGRRYLRCLEMMYGFSPGKFLLVFWSSITPVFCMALFVCSIYVSSKLEYNPKTLDAKYEYPQWAIALGWLLAFACILALPITATYKIVTTPGETLRERINQAMAPNFSPKVARMLKENEELYAAQKNGPKANYEDSLNLKSSNI